MIIYPNSKINIGLRVLGKRPDNFHNLETIFYPLPHFDILEVIESDEEQEIIFTSSGIQIISEHSDNLCVRAYQLLKKKLYNLPHLYMHLHKAIPVGAGLGGGSADAAFTLKLLNDKFSLGLSEIDLMKIAAELGSDCAFFIRNMPALGKGRGEILEPIEVDLSRFDILLVNPGIHISTESAFKGLRIQNNPYSLAEAIKQPVAEWKSHIKNDFEETIFRAYPGIEKIKTQLYQQGALYASMSGSGSSVYGIFLKNDRPGLSFPSSFFYKWF